VYVHVCLRVHIMCVKLPEHSQNSFYQLACMDLYIACERMYAAFTNICGTCLNNQQDKQESDGNTCVRKVALL
jgi:hypothetical protein